MPDNILYNPKCPQCAGFGYTAEVYEVRSGKTYRKSCPECLTPKNVVNREEPTIISEAEKAVEVKNVLLVDREDLKLIKIGLFEISEYLNSPRLAELRQRVNSILEIKKSAIKINKEPDDSIPEYCRHHETGEPI